MPGDVDDCTSMSEGDNRKEERRTLVGSTSALKHGPKESWPQWFKDDYCELVKSGKDNLWVDLTMAWVAFEEEMDFPVGTVSPVV